MDMSYWPNYVVFLSNKFLFKFQAFEKARDAVCFDEGTLVLIQEDNYDKALDFLHNSFLKTEPISQSVNIEWGQDIQDIFRKSFEQNMSFMLLNETNGDVMGARLMQVMKHDDKHEADQFKDIGMKKLIGFWHYSAAKTNFFEHFPVKEAVNFFGLGVAEKYRKRGIGTKLMDVSMQFIENLGIFPICIKGEASSSFSQKIYEKLGMERLADVA